MRSAIFCRGPPGVMACGVQFTYRRGDTGRTTKDGRLSICEIHQVHNEHRA